MMATFVVEADGSVSVTQQELQQDPLSRESRLPEIVEKLKDPRTPVADIMRLICIEHVLLAQEITAYGRDNPTASMFRRWRERQTALNALQKSVLNTAAASKKEVLNFDGPKFQFVLGRLSKLFREAAEKALGKGSETSVQSIMMHFRDLLAENEPDIRRETERIGAEGVSQ